MIAKNAPTIFIVDDDAPNRDLLALQMQRAHFQVKVASNGIEALELIQQVLPDIILLDVMMPGLDGYETCKQIKANPTLRDIPILFLSGLKETDNKVRGFEAGGVDYVAKPVQLPEVLARIQAHLTIRQLQRQLERQNDLLEERVQQRTAELSEEVVRRKQQEEEKHKLLEVVCNQSEDLRAMTQWLLQRQQQQRTDVTKIIDPQIKQGLARLRYSLEEIQTLCREAVDRAVIRQIVEHVRKSKEVVTQLESELQEMTANLGADMPAALQSDENPLLLLSAREREVLQLVVDGKGNHEIANLLYLAEPTVRTYRNRIMQKLQIEDMPTLMKFAIKHRITPLR